MSEGTGGSAGGQDLSAGIRIKSVSRYMGGSTVKARKSLAIVVAVLIIAGIVAALQISAAQEEGAGGISALTTPGERTAVAAVAAESVTEYEPDPFEPERLRSSTVRVKRVAVIYSDGSVEVKRCE